MEEETLSEVWEELKKELEILIDGKETESKEQ